MITSIVYLGPEADKTRDHVAGCEVEEYLGIGPRKLKALVRDGYIHPIGAVGGDPSKPIFSMKQVRALHPGEQEELFPVEQVAPEPVLEVGGWPTDPENRARFAKPEFAASIPSSWLGDRRWRGRLIWARPNDAASTANQVRWMRLIEATIVDQWTDCYALAADVDGTEYRCSLAPNVYISVSSLEYDGATEPLPDSAPGFRTLG